MITGSLLIGLFLICLLALLFSLYELSGWKGWIYLLGFTGGAICVLAGNTIAGWLLQLG